MLYEVTKCSRGIRTTDNGREVQVQWEGLPGTLNLTWESAKSPSPNMNHQLRKPSQGAVIATSAEWIVQLSIYSRLQASLSGIHCTIKPCFLGSEIQLTTTEFNPQLFTRRFTNIVYERNAG